MPPNSSLLHSTPKVDTTNSANFWQVFNQKIRSKYVWLLVGILLLTGLVFGAYRFGYLPLGGQSGGGVGAPAGDGLPNTGNGSGEDEIIFDENGEIINQNTGETQPATGSNGSAGPTNQAPRNGSTAPSNPGAGSGSNPSPTNPNPNPPPPPPPPGGFTKPNASNTGPRYSITRTMSADEALAELRRTGYLSRVRITNTLRLSGSDGRNWVIEDSIIEATSHYGLQTYQSIGAFTGSYNERPIFRHVEIRGRAVNGNGGNCSSVYYGSNAVLENMNMYGCVDIVKATYNTTLKSSWLHDNDHPSGAHCDAIQIVSGTNIQIIGNRLDAYVGYSSDGSQNPPSGATCSGGLQTGSVTNNISARFENNWFAGGHYTIRGWSSSTTYDVSYVFRNNKWMRNGTSVALGRTDLPPNRYGPVYGTLGDFDSSNVWEDTGQPVR